MPFNHPLLIRQPFSGLFMHSHSPDTRIQNPHQSFVFITLSEILVGFFGLFCRTPCLRIFAGQIFRLDHNVLGTDKSRARKFEFNMEE